MKTLKPQEVFEYLKPEYKYIAMDEWDKGDVIWRAYIKKPKISESLNIWIGNLREKSLQALNIDYDGDWKDSLHCREPEIKEQTTEQKLFTHLLERIEKLEKIIKTSVIIKRNTNDKMP